MHHAALMEGLVEAHVEPDKKKAAATAAAKEAKKANKAHTRVSQRGIKTGRRSQASRGRGQRERRRLAMRCLPRIQETCVIMQRK